MGSSLRTPRWMSHTLPRPSTSPLCTRRQPKVVPVVLDHLLARGRPSCISGWIDLRFELLIPIFLNLSLMTISTLLEILLKYIAMELANANFQNPRSLIAWPVFRGTGLNTNLLTLDQIRRTLTAPPSAPKKLKRAKPQCFSWAELDCR